MERAKGDIVIACPDGIAPQYRNCLRSLLGEQPASTAIFPAAIQQAMQLHETKWLIVTAWLLYRRSGKYPPNLLQFKSADFKDRRLFAEFLSEMLDLCQAIMEHHPLLRRHYSDPLEFWKCCLAEWKGWEIGYIYNLNKTDATGKAALVKWRRNAFLKPIKELVNPIPKTPRTVHNHRLLHYAIETHKQATELGDRKFIRYYWNPFIERLGDYHRDQDRNPGLKSILSGEFGLQYLDKSNIKKRCGNFTETRKLTIQGL
jgi:hypothetical protein